VAGYAGLAVFGVLMAAIGLYYSLRVVAVLFMRPDIAAQPVTVPATGPAAGLTLAVLTGLLLGLGLFSRAAPDRPLADSLGATS